jgi:dolichyl-phosphate-mannose-protein mannosyltransferase
MHKFMSNFILRKHSFIIACAALVLCAFFARIIRLNWPSTFYFDEVYHGFTATTYLHNDPKGYEFWQTPPKGVAYEWTHPPLAKLLMAAGMVVFGENAFGWRISSVLFGTGVIAMTGLISYQLFRSKRLTLLAILFVSMDNLLLTMSRLAMNDMHFLFFALVAVSCYLSMKEALFKPTIDRKKAGRFMFLAAISLALSLASKWTALYVGAGIALDFVASIVIHRKFPPTRFFLAAVFATILIPLIYVLSYTQFFLQGHTFTQFKDTTQQMWWYHTNLKATHPYQSQPWQWILDLRPVWFHVDYSANEAGKVANIYNTDNPLLLWFGLASSATFALYLITRLVGMKLHDKEKTLLFSLKDDHHILTLLILYGMLWIPWLASPRIMFFYHYAPAIPFLCILFAVLANRLLRTGGLFAWIGRFLILSLMLCFVALYPLNTGIFMPQDYFTSIFTVFPTWK